MAAANYNTAQKKREREHRRRHRRRREQRRQRRDHNVANQYRKEAADFPHHKVEFRLRCIQNSQSKRRTSFNLTPLVESFEWTDGGAFMEGQVVARRPQDVRGGEGPMLRDGDQVRCYARIHGKWRELWTMRVHAPDEALGEGIVNFQLRTDAHNLQLGRDNWKFKKSKKGDHKNGWRAHEIVKSVCRQVKVRRGRIARGKHDIKNLEMRDASPLDVMLRAYREEREHQGTRFVFSWRHGRLHITKLRRQPFLYFLSKQILSAYSSHDRSEDFFTALTLTANLDEDESDEKGKKKKPIKVTVHNHKAVRRYGYIHRRESLDSKVKDRQELYERANRRLARCLYNKTLDRISITHKGIPFIRKGDAVRLRLPEYGIKHRRRRPREIHRGEYEDILFVRSVTHSVVGGDYTMDIEFGLADAWAEMREDIRDARDERRRERRRREREAKKDD